ncbi:MAG: (deoxy)nucleoside triphosphate pyrophosphohydrolase [Acidobacteria bacterium]|nr:(deoxy)nucleoside triphosphate pyrophosphohydrolase [Acidobacteriota bacterium]
MTPIRVVAALIARHGRLLICQRRHDDRHPLKWEFPGGKVEAGEAPEEALRRELREELAIEATIGPLVTSYRYAYPGRPAIELLFYKVERFAGEPANQIFEQIVWEEATRLPGYDFLEGDIEFVQALAAGRYFSAL